MDRSDDEEDPLGTGAANRAPIILAPGIDAKAGSFVIAPAGMPHDFENRTAKRAGALDVSVPGDFEPHMHGIAEWFRARSGSDARTTNAPRKPRRER